MNSFNIDQDIQEKKKEFEKYLEAINERMSKERAAFESAMSEYRRIYQEREHDHKQKVQSLEMAREELNDIFKNNSRAVQHCRKELIMVASNNLHILESRKEIVRVKVEYNQSIFTNLTKFFEVKYFSQMDCSKKVRPMQIISQAQGEDKTVYGCDTSDNEIYMADYTKNQVYIVNKKNGQSLQPIGVGHISHPWGVKVHKGAVYVSEPEMGRVSVFNKNGGLRCCRRLDHRASNPENATSKPTGIDVDKNGVLYIADSGQKKVHIIDSKPRIMFPKGEIRESLVCPQDVKVVGGKVYVLDHGDTLVKVFDRDWNYIKSIIPKSGRTSPVFFTVNSCGQIFMCDQDSRCIKVYDSQGNLFHQIPYPPTADYPSGISVNQKEIILTNYGEDLCYIF